MVYSGKLIIQNIYGIHCRPSSTIARIAQGYPCNISLAFKEDIIDVKSILSLISLGLSKGDEVVLKTEGKLAQEAFEKITKLLSATYDYE